MSIADAAIAWNFARTPGWIDSRGSFTRTSAGRGADLLGRLPILPNNTGRWRWSPITGIAEGLLIEPRRTNHLLWSEAP